MHKLLIGAATLGLLAGCNQQDSSLDQARVTMAAPVSGAKAGAIMHERHEGMEQVGKLNKQLSRFVQSQPIDAQAVRMDAEAMDVLAQKAANWFPAGTGPESGKTRAKPEIWQKPQDFSAKLTGWQAAARNIRTAARSADPIATRAAFADLGKSCKACHDSYRAEKKD